LHAVIVKPVRSDDGDGVEHHDWTEHAPANDELSPL
jgi:hypothetical protein